ncbi:class I adenylate-forming enzyme family protein [Streptomyces plumbiresistens]|uniref:Long-chain fatty acid--CoA ligase n=1 Tax=Streptomyces plumbiresistens TaxID=511811 RepID=A0ABP7SLT4_9ACTN
MNLAELALSRARVAGNAIAVQMGSKRLTYAEFVRESDRVASGLRELGIRRGDRVMMFSENSIEFLVAYLATARLGAIFTPIHASFQVSELEYVLANATPSAIIAQAALWKRLERCGEEHLPSARVVIGPARGDLLSFQEIGRTSAPVGVEPVDDQTPVLICYTSGTTDRPQPVTRSHANEIWNARTYARVWDYRAGDRALVTLPLSWVWGLSTLAQALLCSGGTVILHKEFEASAALAEIESSRVSLFAGTMSMYTAILSELGRHNYDLSSLRRLYRGGEPINNEVVKALQARIGVPLSDGYATTEAAPIIAVDPVHDLDAPVGAAGRLVPGAKVRIVDERSNDVPVGEVGEAWLSGPGIMLGYWNEPEITAERLTPDGWFRSGDLLVEGDNGYYFVVGRSADIIIRNGAKVAPAEVEAALNSLPGIRDSVAVGVPDEDFGESIVACVLLDPGCIMSADDVYDLLSDRIARFKLPSLIQFVSELPVWRNEKRDRAWIRRRALADLELDSTPAPDTVRRRPAADHRPHLRLVE